MRKLALAAIAFLLVGCGTTPSSTSVTAATALTSTENYLSSALAIRPAPAFTKPTTATTDTSSCVGPKSDSDFTGQVKATVEYTAPAQDGTAFLTSVKDVWSKQGFSVSPGQNNVAAYTKDGYTLYANYYPAVHQLALDGNSPCVWPNGTPKPTS